MIENLQINPGEMGQARKIVNQMKFLNESLEAYHDSILSGRRRATSGGKKLGTGGGAAKKVTTRSSPKKQG
jgi:hypothetical protein